MTGEGITRCNLEVGRMFVGSLLFKEDWWRGNQEVDYDSDYKDWVSRKTEAQANPGDECIGDGTYALRSEHYAWPLDGTILHGSTYTSRDMTCR